MNCFSCFQSQKSKTSFVKREHGSPSSPKDAFDSKFPENKKQKPGDVDRDNKSEIAAQTFTFREIAVATRHFRQECLLGEGGFGRVFKGTLAATGQIVAVKQLDRSGLQENKEFLAEVMMLSLLHHPNLVNLVGYCADGDQRLLVYDYVKGGCLHEHLLDLTPETEPLDWFTRMRIAFGAAKGLEYLHDEANPPVVDGNIKPSNILLDEDFNPLLSDFGLVKLGHSGDKMHVHSRLMGTYGYSAPEYARGGELTVKSDVYSFGVILLELITGRRAIDTTKPINEQNLVAWAQPIFRDPKRFPDMADPVLKKRFPEKDLNQAVAIAAMCLQEESAARPLMSDVVTALSFLSMVTDESILAPPPPVTPPLEDLPNHDQRNAEDEHSSDSDNRDGESGHIEFSISDHEDTDNEYKDIENDHKDSEIDHHDRESEHGDESDDEIGEIDDHKMSRKWSKISSMRSMEDENEDIDDHKMSGKWSNASSMRSMDDHKMSRKWSKMNSMRSMDDENEDTDDHKMSRKWSKMNSMRSIDESVCSNHKRSMRLQSRNARSIKDGYESHYESVLSNSSHHSSRESQFHNALSHKSSIGSKDESVSDSVKSGSHVDSNDRIGSISYRCTDKSDSNNKIDSQESRIGSSSYRSTGRSMHESSSSSSSSSCSSDNDDDENC